MLEKIKKIIEKSEALASQLADPEILSDPKRLREISKQHHELEPLVKKGKSYLKVMDQIEEDEALLGGDDLELKALVKEELDELAQKREVLEEELKLLLLPKDPRDDRNTIVEIRAGTGGEEAALFAADLFRMYSRYAERKGWQLTALSSSETGNKGFKEIIFSLEGEEVFGEMKFEGGVHRVQRVPETEASGRIHTSAATVAVLPEASEIEVDIDPADLRIDTFRASGHGGQHVNKTESAVRITHMPTNLVVTCQDEKSQHKNRMAAMKVLRSRLLALEGEKQRAKRDQARKSMISTGDRSAKIRTYNFPQSRVTDHRIDVTLYKLDDILDGDISVLVEKLRIGDQVERLKAETLN
ncbi:MAG: peptide chain release factor 1 [Candidatus Neomarinimicrobiota bacterium]